MPQPHRMTLSDFIPLRICREKHLTLMANSTTSPGTRFHGQHKILSNDSRTRAQPLLYKPVSKFSMTTVTCTLRSRILIPNPTRLREECHVVMASTVTL